MFNNMQTTVTKKKNYYDLNKMADITKIGVGFDSTMDENDAHGRYRSQNYKEGKLLSSVAWHAMERSITHLQVEPEAKQYR
jgi:hypothetical protein